MKSIIVYQFLLLSLIFGTQAPAVCPDPDTVTTIPKLADVQVKPTVTYDVTSKVYSFSYSVKNGSNSTGCLWLFEIDIKKPVGGKALPSSGLNNAKYSAHLDYSTESPEIVPVTFPTLPKRDNWIIWDAGLNADGLATWGSTRYIYEIAPGESLSGLILTSYGLPGIRDYRLEPKYIAEDEAVYNMGVPKAKYHADAYKYLKAFHDSISGKGKTIGPTAQPADFKPADFIDYIINLKHQAVSLGWIKNEGIVNSLDVKLDNAKKKITEGSPGAAKNILNAFTNEVEAQGCATFENCPPGKHLTSEAYALLKYNAQYLIDNLSK